MAKKFKWQYSKEYLLHLILIVFTLFGGYWIGDKLLDFQGSYSLIKMFLWFSAVLFIADNFWENLLNL